MWICVGTAEDRADSINEYQFQETCRHGDYKENPENYDLEKIVVIRLGAKGEKSDNPMVRLLSKLFSQTISKEEKIEMLQRLPRESPLRKGWDESGTFIVETCQIIVSNILFFLTLWQIYDIIDT